MKCWATAKWWSRIWGHSSQLPGLAGISVLASGAVALIYNPAGPGDGVWRTGSCLVWRYLKPAQSAQAAPVDTLVTVENEIPLVLVVDDSITVRRVTQRLLKREGYRVTLASDGLDALERLRGRKADGGALGYRDAAHGRIRPGSQHSSRCAGAIYPSSS